ncbi:MAG: hypothetical protein RID90_09540 [Marinovum algicola]
MRLILAAVLILLSGLDTAEASYYARCDVLADVVTATGGRVAITVLAIAPVSGHGPCETGPGRTHLAPAAALDGETGRLCLHVDYGNGMGPNGVVEWFDWRLAEPPSTSATDGSRDGSDCGV